MSARQRDTVCGFSWLLVGAWVILNSECDVMCDIMCV